MDDKERVKRIKAYLPITCPPDTLEEDINRVFELIEAENKKSEHRWQLNLKAVRRIKALESQLEARDKELEQAQAELVNQQLDQGVAGLEQALYEAENPILPNGESITVSEMYTAWQKAEARALKLEAFFPKHIRKDIELAQQNDMRVTLSATWEELDALFPARDSRGKEVINNAQNQ